MKEIILKFNKTKSWFFEKVNEINKLSARLIKIEREKNQINKTENEKGDVTTDNTEIQRIIRDYYEQLFPCDSAGKESTCNAGDLGSTPGLGRSPGEGKGYPLQYSDLENSMNCIVHGVTKSWTQLSDFHTLYGNKMDSLQEMDRFLEKFNLPRLNQEEIEIMNNPVISTEIKTDKNLPKNKSPGPDGCTGVFYQTFREALIPILLKHLQKISEEGALPNSFYEATITLILKPDKNNTQKKKIRGQYH